MGFAVHYSYNSNKVWGYSGFDRTLLEGARIIYRELEYILDVWRFGLLSMCSEQ